MDEKNLSTLALATSFLGVLGLFILSFFLQYDLVAIGDIDSSMEGKTVRVEGEIQSIIQKEQVTLLNIHDETGEITAILFSEEKISFKENTFVEVVGTISNYNCDLELKAEKISLLTF